MLQGFAIQPPPIARAIAAAPHSRRRTLWTTLLLAAGALALALGQIARLPAERGWTTDDGNEYFLTRSIAAGGAGAWSHPALPYPGQPRSTGPGGDGSDDLWRRL